MVTRQQRSQLIEAYQDEPLVIAGAVLKCAACLIILVGLVVVGAAGEPTDRPVVQAQRDDDSYGVGTTSHARQQAPVLSNQPAPALAISPDPAHAIDTRPVVFDRSCAGAC